MTTLIQNPPFKVNISLDLNYVKIEEHERKEYKQIFKEAVLGSKESVKKGMYGGMIVSLGLVGFTTFKVMMLGGLFFASMGSLVGFAFYVAYYSCKEVYMNEYAFANQVPRINFSHLQKGIEEEDLRPPEGTVSLDQLYTYAEFAKDDTLGFSKEINSRLLKSFVNVIQERRPFLGTPPEGTSELDLFYERLENMVLCCMYKLDQEYQEFMEEVHYVIPELGSADFEKYRTIQEARMNLAYDLAESKRDGKCAARWMGEVSLQYNTIVGNTKSATLAEKLYSKLADCRYEIATAYINRTNTDTHFYAAYMQALGKELGIKGSGTLLEHLFPLLDYQIVQARDDFYHNYSAQKILHATRELFKSSTEARELLVEWIKQNASDWNISTYQQEAEELKAEAIALYRSKKPEVMTEFKHLELFHNALIHLIKKGKVRMEDIGIQLLGDLEAFFEYPLFKQESSYIHSDTRVAKNNWKVAIQAILSKDPDLIKSLANPQALRSEQIRGEIESCLQKQKRAEQFKILFNNNGFSGYDIQRNYSEKELVEFCDYAALRKQQDEFLEQIWKEESQIPSDAVLLWFLHSHQVLNY